ncbi:MAG: 2-C-methyl-D-erythritol 4-phosphate cytidylyltransferase, partial [Spirochaetota bacterium]|nr:2-C-methyl-D-erythritol 4-phosphate cytidylyltransferase [Spirochaetota bacterium]
MTRRNDHQHIILLSAGSGTRMQSSEKKQFLALNGSPLFVWSVRTFLTLIEDYPISLYLTHSPGDLSRFRDLLSEHINPA